MFRLSDMFELTISQRWWRQARPRAQCLAVNLNVTLKEAHEGSHCTGAACEFSTLFWTAHAVATVATDSLE